MNGKIVLFSLIVISLSTAAFCIEPIKVSCMSQTDQAVYKALNQADSSPISPGDDAMEIGLQLLNLPSNTDLWQVNKSVRERLKLAHAQKLGPVSEARFVLQTHENLSEESLRNRLLLINRLVIFFDMLDPRGCAHRTGSDQPFQLLRKA